MQTDWEGLSRQRERDVQRPCKEGYDWCVEDQQGGQRGWSGMRDGKVEGDEDREREGELVTQNRTGLTRRGESVMSLPTPGPQLSPTPTPSTSLFC